MKNKLLYYNILLDTVTMNRRVFVYYLSAKFIHTHTHINIYYLLKIIIIILHHSINNVNSPCLFLNHNSIVPLLLTKGIIYIFKADCIVYAGRTGVLMGLMRRKPASVLTVK